LPNKNKEQSELSIQNATDIEIIPHKNAEKNCESERANSASLMRKKDYESEQKGDKNYLEANIDTLLAQKTMNEKLENELINDEPIEFRKKCRTPVEPVNKMYKQQQKIKPRDKSPIFNKRAMQYNSNNPNKSDSSSQNHGISMTEAGTPKEYNPHKIEKPKISGTLTKPTQSSANKIQKSGRNATKSPQKSARIVKSNKPVVPITKIPQNVDSEKIKTNKSEMQESNEYISNLIKEIEHIKPKETDNKTTQLLAEEEKALNDAIMRSHIGFDSPGDVVNYNTSEEMRETISSSAKEITGLEIPHSQNEEGELLLTLGKPAANNTISSINPTLQQSKAENKLLGYIAPVKFKNYEKLSRPALNASPFRSSIGKTQRNRDDKKQVATTMNGTGVLNTESRNLSGKTLGTAGTIGAKKKIIKNNNINSSPSAKAIIPEKKNTKSELPTSTATPHFMQSKDTKSS